MVYFLEDQCSISGLDPLTALNKFDPGGNCCQGSRLLIYIPPDRVLIIILHIRYSPIIKSHSVISIQILHSVLKSR